MLVLFIHPPNALASQKSEDNRTNQSCANYAWNYQRAVVKRKDSGNGERSIHGDLDLLLREVTSPRPSCEILPHTEKVNQPVHFRIALRP